MLEIPKVQLPNHKKIPPDKKETNPHPKSKRKKISIKLISSKKITLIIFTLKSTSLKSTNFLSNIPFIVLMESIKIDSFTLQHMLEDKYLDLVMLKPMV